MSRETPSASRIITHATPTTAMLSATPHDYNTFENNNDDGDDYNNILEDDDAMVSEEELPLVLESSSSSLPAGFTTYQGETTPSSPVPRPPAPPTSLSKSNDGYPSKESGHTDNDDDESSNASVTVWDTMCNVLERCFQPPVIGALLGIFVAIVPGLRGVFVDLVDRSSDAPLEWFFDGLYAVGQAAVVSRECS